MKPVIVDASVAAKWLIEEDGSAPARELLRGSDLHAPQFIFLEVANILWKKTVRGEILPAHATAVAEALPRLIGTIHDDPGLLPAAFELAMALNHPLYDCLYLACAVAVDGVLATADKRLLTRTAASPFAALTIALTP